MVGLTAKRNEKPAAAVIVYRHVKQDGLMIANNIQPAIRPRLLAALCGVICPKIKWSPDGLRFLDAGEMPNQSTGLFTPDPDSDPGHPRGLEWGLEVYMEVRARGLRRFDCMPALEKTSPSGGQ
jgi:hypothetical protein